MIKSYWIILMYDPLTIHKRFKLVYKDVYRITRQKIFLSIY